MTILLLMLFRVFFFFLLLLLKKKKKKKKALLPYKCGSNFGCFGFLLMFVNIFILKREQKGERSVIK
jgi:NADH:ubiquinone oxidoreductase subunit 3 (subunit A)